MVRSELVRPATGTAARQVAREGDRSADRDHQRIVTDAELDFRTARRARSLRGSVCRAAGSSASNPPARQSRIHRSTLSRETRADSGKCDVAGLLDPLPRLGVYVR
nr:hypothetical protein [Nonomuraea basaltis]